MSCDCGDNGKSVVSCELVDARVVSKRLRAREGMPRRASRLEEEDGDAEMEACEGKGDGDGDGDGDGETADESTGGGIGE